MKKAILLIISIATVIGMKAQEPQSPLFFHNHLEYMTYQMEHPSGFPMKPYDSQSRLPGYTQKLDSVVGSDNFDWTRWKNVYVYPDTVDYPSDRIVVETSYEWRDQAWVPTVKSEIVRDSGLMNYYRWTDNDWELYYRVVSQYTTCGHNTLLESVTSEQFADTTWVGVDRSTFEYDSLCNMVLNNNYTMNANGEWDLSIKYECGYVDGRLVSSLATSSGWNGMTQQLLDSLFYDEQHHCTSVISYRKGGWGPGGNNWRTTSKYEFEYADGKLVSELYYASTGWFGGEMSLYDKADYSFDEHGNELLKTNSIYNEADWIVRDSYTNTFDGSMSASSLLGLASVWESTLEKGMGYAWEESMPLANKWLSCSIISSYLDTEFKLYYSGFTEVMEFQDDGFKAYSSNGRLIVENDLPANITVYDLLGRVMDHKTQTVKAEFNLTPGLYLVGNGTRFIKTVVQ